MVKVFFDLHACVQKSAVTSCSYEEWYAIKNCKFTTGEVVNVVFEFLI